MLNLRMSSPCHQGEAAGGCCDLSDLRGNRSDPLLLDKIWAMRQLERTTYRCENYVVRRRNERMQRRRELLRGQEQQPVNCDADFEPPETSDSCYPHQYHRRNNDFDDACREKMCDWSYRLCSHFHADRECVSVAFSCLDRFLDRCSCDRTAYKLASISCLHIAARMAGGSRSFASLSCLSELSRGEFDPDHIDEMTRIVLQTLSWRLNPPTARSFVGHFLQLIPEDVPQGIFEMAAQRALFFAELSVFDNALVAEYPSVVGYAAILNALEGLSSSELPRGAMERFQATVQDAASMNYEPYSMEALRARLWHLYERSEQCKQEQQERQEQEQQQRQSSQQQQQQQQHLIRSDAESPTPHSTADKMDEDDDEPRHGQHSPVCVGESFLDHNNIVHS